MKDCQHVRCPNCEKYGVWLGAVRFWACRSCNARWCEISVSVVLAPPLPADCVPCWVPDDEHPQLSPWNLWVRRYLVEPIYPEP